MPTLTSATTLKWTNSLNGIEAALKLAENVEGIPHHIWRQVWQAKVSVAVIRDDLLRLAVVPVEVETV